MVVPSYPRSRKKGVHSKTGTASCPHRQHPLGCPASAYVGPQAAVLHHRDRGFKRAGDDGGPPSGPFDCRHGPFGRGGHR